MDPRLETVAVIVVQGTSEDAIDNATQALVSALSEFRRFSELPAELRLRVWRYVLGGPRIIKVKIERDLANYFPGRNVRPFKPEKITFKYKCSSENENPGTLLACKESRDETLKRLPNGLKLFKNGQVTRFHPAIDTIFIDDLSLANLVGLKWDGLSRFEIGFKNVQNLAVQDPQGISINVMELSHSFFIGIKKLVLGVKKDERSYGGPRGLQLALHNKTRKQARAKGLKYEMGLPRGYLTCLYATEFGFSHIRAWSDGYSPTTVVAEPEVVQYDSSEWEDMRA